MAEIKLLPLASASRANVADRSFPFDGRLGLSPVHVEGTFQFRSLRKGATYGVKSVVVRIRCAEKSSTSLLGAAHEADLWHTEVVIWEPSVKGVGGAGGDAYEDLEALDRPFSLTIPVAAAAIAPSAMQMRRWKVGWKLEAVVRHVAQPGVGDTIVHGYDLRLKNYLRANPRLSEVDFSSVVGLGGGVGGGRRQGLLEGLDTPTPTRHSVDYACKGGSWTADLQIVPPTSPLDVTPPSSTNTTYEPTDAVPVSLKLRWDSHLYEEVQVTLALVRQLELRSPSNVAVAPSPSTAALSLDLRPCPSCSASTPPSPAYPLPTPSPIPADLLADHAPMTRAAKRKSMPPPPTDTLNSLNLEESTNVITVPSPVLPAHASLLSCTCRGPASSSRRIRTPPSSATPPPRASVSRTTLAKCTLGPQDMTWTSDTSCSMTTELVSQRNEGAWSFGETVRTRLATLSFFVVASVKVSRARRSKPLFGRSASGSLNASASGDSPISADYSSGPTTDTILLPPLEIIVVPRASAAASKFRSRSLSPKKSDADVLALRRPSPSTSSASSSPSAQSPPPPYSATESPLLVPRSRSAAPASSARSTTPSIRKQTLKASLGGHHAPSTATIGIYSLGHNANLTFPLRTTPDSIA